MRNLCQNINLAFAYLELFGIAVAVLNWIKRFKNRRVYLFTDNKTARDIIDSNSSKCRNCMVLMRLIILESMIWNVRVYAKYVKSKDNETTDSLSRLDFKRFRKVAPSNGKRAYWYTRKIMAYGQNLDAIKFDVNKRVNRINIINYAFNICRFVE